MRVPGAPGGHPPGAVGAVAAGGALGSWVRYGLARLVPVNEGGFPWSTFGANVTGSLVLGFLLILILERFPPSRYLRPFAATGFLGAFTTFSAFAVESDRLLAGGRLVVGVAYAVASLAAGLAAAWLGITLARRVPARRRGSVVTAGSFDREVS